MNHTESLIKVNSHFVPKPHSVPLTYLFPFFTDQGTSPKLSLGTICEHSGPNVLHLLLPSVINQSLLLPAVTLLLHTWMLVG